MAALDKIRLTGLLRRSPAPAGLLYWTSSLRGIVASDIRHPLFARFFDRLSRAMEPQVGPRRDELLAGLSGRVLEVGAGNGINFGHYPASVDEVVAIEPEPYMRAKAQEAATNAALPVIVQPGMAEELDFADGSFDAAVVCLVLCSVGTPSRALAELYRVLRPGGELRFFEHVRAHRPAIARLQAMVDGSRLWPSLAGGCHCSRDTVGSIEAAGFRVQRNENVFLTPAWAITNPHALGIAARPR